MDRRRCRHCHAIFVPDPRVKNHEYCNHTKCQRAKKAHWQREKVRRDLDYQADHRDAQKNWQQQHPDYWKDYRGQHPDYVQTNRRKQKKRDQKRRLKNLAKMDSIKPFPFIKSGSYYITPDLAKMDSKGQKIIIIPAD